MSDPKNPALPRPAPPPREPGAPPLQPPAPKPMPRPPKDPHTALHVAGRKCGDCTLCVPVKEIGKEAGQQARSRRVRDPKDFDEVYRNAAHIAKAGWYGIPASAFRNAIISVCRTVGFKMTLAKLSVFVIADGFSADGTPLVKITKGKPIKDFRPARNDNGSTWRNWRDRSATDGDKKAPYRGLRWAKVATLGLGCAVAGVIGVQGALGREASISPTHQTEISDLLLPKSIAVSNVPDHIDSHLAGLQRKESCVRERRCKFGQPEKRPLGGERNGVFQWGSDGKRLYRWEKSQCDLASSTDFIGRCVSPIFEFDFYLGNFANFHVPDDVSIEHHIGAQLGARGVLLLHSAPNQSQSDNGQQDCSECRDKRIMRISESFSTSNIRDDEAGQGIWLVLAILAGGFSAVLIYTILK
jgi:hypothetical protein